MSEIAYPPARSVAETVAAHFRRHGGKYAGHLPDAGVVERIVDAAFWASLRREEGRAPTISIAYLPPAVAGHPLQFEQPLPLDPATLTRLAPAVERPGIHLGVWRDSAEPYIWGATRTLPPWCFVLEVVEPGLLVIKHRRADPGGKFGNVAVLEGDQVSIVDVAATMATECPDFVQALLAFDAPGKDGQGVLLQLALSMRSHGHGGSLLVVPHGTVAWRSSILWPVRYTVAPPFTKLSEVMAQAAAQGNDPAWRDAFRAAVDAVGGLTAVDGAAVLSDRWDVLAFGAKIGRADGNTTVEEVLLKEPIVGRRPVTMNAAELGGTRHLSAAQFVHEQRDALALVASQDRRFTVFTWGDEARRVTGYRVETLLL